MSEAALFSSCPFCGSDDIVIDYIEGVVPCRSCGLLLRNRLVTDQAEWRKFKDEPDKLERAERVKTNPYLNQEGQTLATGMIGKTGTAMAKALYNASQAVAAKHVQQGVAVPGSSVAPELGEGSLAKIFSQLKKFVVGALKRDERTLDQCMQITKYLYSDNASSVSHFRSKGFQHADFILVLCVAQCRLGEAVSFGQVLQQLGDWSFQVTMKDVAAAYRRLENLAPALSTELTQSVSLAGSGSSKGSNARTGAAQLSARASSRISSSDPRELIPQFSASLGLATRDEAEDVLRCLRHFLEDTLRGGGETFLDRTLARSAWSDMRACCAASVYLVAVLSGVVERKSSVAVQARIPNPRTAEKSEGQVEQLPALKKAKVSMSESTSGQAEDSNEANGGGMKDKQTALQSSAATPAGQGNKGKTGSSTSSSTSSTMVTVQKYDQLQVLFPTIAQTRMRDAIRVLLFPTINRAGQSRALVLHGLSDSYARELEFEVHNKEKLRKVLNRLFPPEEWDIAGASTGNALGNTGNAPIIGTKPEQEQQNKGPGSSGEDVGG
ncbi:unnamed protein product [Amoebophrya sp. A25]|nr:unnamed protein product [Amoebophrya sp. A25]|eukprot:GSA25T00002758001.1